MRPISHTDIIKICIKENIFSKYVPPVPGKMRPEMVKEIQIEILNGGEILVN